MELFYLDESVLDEANKGVGNVKYQKQFQKKQEREDLKKAKRVQDIDTTGNVFDKEAQRKYREAQERKDKATQAVIKANETVEHFDIFSGLDF